MEYKYAPIYKYVVLFILIYMFMKHQRIIPQNKILLNSLTITIIFAILDYMIIRNHPQLLNTKENKYLDSDEDVDKIMEAFDSIDSEESTGTTEMEDEYM